MLNIDLFAAWPEFQIFLRHGAEDVRNKLYSEDESALVPYLAVKEDEVQRIDDSFANLTSYAGNLAVAYLILGAWLSANGRIALKQREGKPE